MPDVLGSSARRKHHHGGTVGSQGGQAGRRRGGGGIVATNNRELYERALIYCHLHRTGALDELENPVYYGRMPPIIGAFAEKVENLRGRYVFAVCTYGGGFGIAVQDVRRAVRSSAGRLAAVFGVHIPQNGFRKPWENRGKI